MLCIEPFGHRRDLLGRLLDGFEIDTGLDDGFHECAGGVAERGHRREAWVVHRGTQPVRLAHAPSRRRAETQCLWELRAAASLWCSLTTCPCTGVGASP